MFLILFLYLSLSIIMGILLGLQILPIAQTSTCPTFPGGTSPFSYSLKWFSSLLPFFDQIGEKNGCHLVLLLPPHLFIQPPVELLSKHQLWIPKVLWALTPHDFSEVKNMILLTSHCFWSSLFHFCIITHCFFSISNIYSSSSLPLNVIDSPSHTHIQSKRMNIQDFP